MNLALAALIAAVAVVAACWWVLFYFHDSLNVGMKASDIWLIVVVAIGIVATSLLYPAVQATRCAMRSRQLLSQDRKHEARVEAERVTDWCWYVVGLGVTALLLGGVLYFLSAEHGTIRHTFLNWDVISDERTRLAIRKGFWVNIKIFMVAEVLVLIWALFIAVLRMLPGKATAPVRFLAVVYTDLFRGLPALLAIYLIVFGIQLSQFPVLDKLTVNQKVIFALVLVYGAYVAEVYRAGLESVHWSQTAAARSLGLSGPQTMRHVVIPQAVRRVIPPLLNDFIGLQKDTALVSVVGVLDVFNRTRLVQNRFFNLSPLTGAALCFVIITIPMARFTDYLIRKDQRRMRAGG
ncbi:MAG: amino acid ABC transporter permease [Acidimicrobiia bacterium]